MSKKEESTAVLEKESEGGPLANILKEQSETNRLLRKYLEKAEKPGDEEEDVEKAKLERKAEEPESAAEKRKEEEAGEEPGDKVTKRVVGGEAPGKVALATKKAMEQTEQGAPKEAENIQPGKKWEPKVTNEDDEPDKDKEKPYPYPYPEEKKAIKKSFPFPYGNVATKREEIVAKQLELANQEITRLNAAIAKMIPADKVEEMVSSRFQQKMQEEGFVPSSGAQPANMEKAEPSEIKKSDEGSDEQTEAEGIVRTLVGKSWEGLIDARRNIDPAYSTFLGARRGLPIKGGM